MPHKRSVALYPEIDGTIEVTIDEKDLRIDTYRSSGKGGQHVKHKNKEVCMKVLRARLYELEIEKKKAESKSIPKAQITPPSFPYYPQASRQVRRAYSATSVEGW